MSQVEEGDAVTLSLLWRERAATCCLRTLIACMAWAGLPAAGAGQPAATAASAPSDSLNVRVYRARAVARQAEQDGQWEAAVQDWAQVLQAMPDDVEALWGEARVLTARLKRNRDALVPVRALARLVPGDPHVWSALCWAQIEAGDRDAAVPDCERAAKMAPDSLVDVTNLAHARLLQGRLADALPLYARAVELAPDESTLRNDVVADLDMFIERGWHAADARVAEDRVLVLWRDDREAARRAERQRIVALATSVLQVSDFSRVAQGQAAVDAALKSAGDYPDLVPGLEYLQQFLHVASILQTGSVDEFDRSAAQVRASATALYGDQHPHFVIVLTLEAAGALFRERYAAAEALARDALAMSVRTYGDLSIQTNRSRTLLGHIYVLDGQQERALELRRKNLDVVQNMTGPDSAATLDATIALATALDQSGAPVEAVPLATRATALAVQLKGVDSPEAIKAEATEGDFCLDAERYEMAEPLLVDARARSERVLGPDHPQTGKILGRLGKLYREMGLPDKALPLTQQSIAIEKAHPDAVVLAPDSPMKQDMRRFYESDDIALTAVYSALGRYDEQLLVTEEGYRTITAVVGPRNPMSLLMKARLGWPHLNLDQPAAALKIEDELLPVALATPEASDQLIAEILDIQAEANSRLGHVQAASEAAQHRLMLLERTNLSPVELADARFTVGRLAKAQDRPELAIFYGKLAVNGLQSMRARLSGLDDELQRGFLHKKEQGYQDLAAWLIEAGRIAEAEQVLAMLKEREVFDLTRSSGADPSRRQADYVGPAEHRALAEQQALSAQGVKQAVELAALERERKAGGAQGAESEARHRELLASAQAWRGDYQRYLTDLGKYFPATAREPARQSADEQTTRLQSRVARDPEGALGLLYVVTRERVAIIVATPRGSFGRFSKVSQATLNRQIVALRQAIADRADTRPAAQALWTMLIEPVQADIQASGARTLVLSLTDALRYVPFAALQRPDGRYLVEDHALAYWAAAADTNPSASAEGWRVSAFGLTKPRAGFPGLPAVRDELAGIVRGEGANGVLPGHIALDEQFSRARFDAALTGDTNVVHVASHFAFRPGDENRSVLLLGAGDSLSIGQLAVMDFSSLELFSLSACDTATGGGVNENGAEVEGLAAVVLKQQARSVLATLWQVSDASTAELMRAFYSQRAQERPPSRAQALREAQLAMLRRGREHAGDRTSPQADGRSWDHPYYWAPFVLSGSWL